MIKTKKDNGVIYLLNINGNYIHYKSHDNIDRASLNFSLTSIIQHSACTDKSAFSQLDLARGFYIEGFCHFFKIKSITVGHQRVMIKVQESDDLTIFADDCKEIQKYLALCVDNNILIGGLTEVGTIKYTLRKL